MTTSDHAETVSGNDPPKTVVYVDRCLTWGGALVGPAHLIRHLDPVRFRAVVVGSAPRTVLEHLFGEHATIYRLRPLLTYEHRQKAAVALAGRGFRWLRGTLIRGVRLLEAAAGIVYHVRLAFIVIRERADIVHLNNGPNTAVPLFLRRKTVLTIHGPGDERYGMLRRRFVNYVHRYVMISAYVRENFVTSGSDPNKAVLVHSPCELPVLDSDAGRRARAEYDLGEGTRLFGIFGRIVPWKGQLQFLQAAVRVLRDIPNARAVVVGDEADGARGYFDEIREFAGTCGVEDRIVFTGYVQDVGPLYNAMDVVLHSSIRPEPFGLVITEAMSYGKPVIASHLGAPPELVRHGRDGYIVDPSDVDEVARHVVRLLTDDGLRNELGANARQRIETDFNAPRFASRIQEIYSQVMDG